MSLKQLTNSSQRNVAPWVFSAATTLEPKALADKDILNCAIYKNITEQLTKHLFGTEKMLRDSLRSGLSVAFEELKLEHFDLDGHFDKAVCTLTLSNRGPTRFWLEIHFFLGESLVTLGGQEGILYFDELN